MVGSMSVPKVFGFPASSYLWVNNGKGKFTDQTKAVAPELIDIGMLRDVAHVNLVGGKEKEVFPSHDKLLYSNR